MKSLFLATALLAPSGAYAGFLSEAEEAAIPHRVTADQVLIVSQDDFIRLSETPATILAHGKIAERGFLLVERNGEYAVLTSAIDDGITVRMPEGEGKDPKKEYCDSSCVDDAWSKGFWGALEGAGKGGAGGTLIGGGIGWWVGGPPGAAAGAAMAGTGGALIGGAGGAAAGASDGFNTCQKEKAEICGGK